MMAVQQSKLSPQTSVCHVCPRHASDLSTVQGSVRSWFSHDFSVDPRGQGLQLTLVGLPLVSHR